VSFHYTNDENLTEANFQRLPETEQWEFYFSRSVGNSFYYASELVVAGGVISLAIDNPQSGDAPAADLNLDARAFAALCDTVTEVSGHITELFGQIIALIVMTSIGEDVETTIVEVPDGPKISSFRLPFFLMRTTPCR
jgi:hypothetical protein